MRDDGVEIDTQQDIETEAVHYYQTLFTGESIKSQDDILKHIPCMISTDEKEQLLLLPTMDEVKKAVWDLSPMCAAGPDGFRGSFYRLF